jgi:dihydrofolate reductase
MMVSLDGYHEGPNHALDWHVVDDDFFAYVTEMLGSIDAILLGRATYERFAGFWPTAKAAEARAMNELPKVVFSQTLTSAAWRNSRLVSGDAAEEIARLKREPGQDLAIFGSNRLATSLAPLGLIDEYRILINPVVLGAGTPLFQGLARPLQLNLLKREPLESGVVIHYYRAAPGSRGGDGYTRSTARA